MAILLQPVFVAHADPDSWNNQDGLISVDTTDYTGAISPRLRQRIAMDVKNGEKPAGDGVFFKTPGGHVACQIVRMGPLPLSDDPYSSTVMYCEPCGQPFNPDIRGDGPHWYTNASCDDDPFKAAFGVLPTDHVLAVGHYGPVMWVRGDDEIHYLGGAGSDCGAVVTPNQLMPHCTPTIRMPAG